MKIKTIVICCIFALTAFGVQTYAANEESEPKQKLTLSELPDPVQKTIQNNLAGGTIVEVAKEARDGETYYEALVQKPGGERMEIKVAQDGKLIDIGKEDQEDNDDDGD